MPRFNKFIGSIESTEFAEFNNGRAIRNKLGYKKLIMKQHREQARVDDENEKNANTIGNHNTIKSNNQTENSVLSTIYRWVKRNL
jgi:hypothetical protein